jgi:hypothetical protein
METWSVHFSRGRQSSLLIVPETLRPKSFNATATSRPETRYCYGVVTWNLSDGGRDESTAGLIQVPKMAVV